MMQSMTTTTIRSVGQITLAAIVDPDTETVRRLLARRLHALQERGEHIVDSNVHPAIDDEPACAWVVSRTETPTETPWRSDDPMAAN